MIGIFGEVMIELQPHSDDLFRRGVAGDTFNTAVMVSRLGNDVGYFTALGTDGFSDAIRCACGHHGLPEMPILTVPGFSPGMYAIENDEKGERTFTYWRNNSAAKQCFSHIETFQTLLNQAEHCTAYYWSGITLALMSKDVLSAWLDFLAMQRAQGKLVFFDTNFRANLWTKKSTIAEAYSRVFDVTDYFFPSEEDLSAIYGFNTIDDIGDFCTTLPCKTIMSATGEVLYWCDGPAESLTLEFSSTMVDATGAGDAFSGGLVHGIVNGFDIAQSISIAHRCASQVVQCKGAILPDSQWLSVIEGVNNYV